MVPKIEGYIRKQFKERKKRREMKGNFETYFFYIFQVKKNK